MRLTKVVAALAVGGALALVPTAAGAAPVTGGAGAEYGEHMSTHARTEGGFTGDMNPGMHQGFAGFDEHH